MDNSTTEKVGEKNYRNLKGGKTVPLGRGLLK